MRSWMVLVLAVAASIAHADGGRPETLQIHFAADRPQSMYVMTNYGLIISHDDGCTFDWVCEQAVGYGTESPQLAVAADGSIYSTSYIGLRRSRDGGCTFDTRLHGWFVSSVALGRDGAIWAATAEGHVPNDVYVSRDQGETFTSVLTDDVRWLSVREDHVAGIDADGVAHVRRRDGEVWTPLATENLVLGSPADLTIAATSPLFVISHGSYETVGDRLYRSTDGATFEEVFAVVGTITDVLVRGETVIVTSRVLRGREMAAGPASISTDGGSTFALLEGAPMLACLTVAPDGDLVGCSTNWEPDFMAITRQDAGTWNKIWRFTELAGPLACAAGTTVDQVCSAPWVSFEMLLMPTGPTCGPTAGPVPPPEEEHAACCCCNAVGGPSGLLLVLPVAWRLFRRRRHGIAASVSATPG